MKHENQSPLKEHAKSAWLKAAVLVLLFAGGSVFLWQTGLVSFLVDKDRMAIFVESLGIWGFAGFILLQVAQVVAAPIPGEITGFLGGYLYGPVLGTILSTVGLAIGSYIAFALARTFGRPLTEKIVGAATMSRFDYLLQHNGRLLVFLLFVLPGMPKDVICYILGLGRMSSMSFLTITTAGRLLSTVMFTCCGYFAHTKDYTLLAAIVISGIALSTGALLYRKPIERALRNLNESYSVGKP